MEIIYQDHYILVCIKPAGVLSTDEPGGLPELCRTQLGDARACVRTVHRLDRVTGGLMVLARTRRAASELSRQVREQGFHKEYLAIVHGAPEQDAGTLSDLLYRDRALRKTLVAAGPGPDVQEARLDYRVLEQSGGLSLCRIRLHTGRTHQIRAQFSARGLPLLGDRKYGAPETGPAGVALWSCALRFAHPFSGEEMAFFRLPPEEAPWCPRFAAALSKGREF